MAKTFTTKYWVLGVGYPAINLEFITLHRRLHISALDQGRTLQDLVREALTDLVANDDAKLPDEREVGA
ncbi:MAG: hypothetical protein R3D68_07290 [Hyphomicrobiaceae bacterium]